MQASHPTGLNPGISGLPSRLNRVQMPSLYRVVCMSIQSSTSITKSPVARGKKTDYWWPLSCLNEPFHDADPFVIGDLLVSPACCQAQEHGSQLRREYGAIGTANALPSL